MAEAVPLLDPPVSRRTLHRLLADAGDQPLGYRYTARRGRPAALYDLRRLMELHAAWVRTGRLLDPGPAVTQNQP